MIDKNRKTAPTKYNREKHITFVLLISTATSHSTKCVRATPVQKFTVEIAIITSYYSAPISSCLHKDHGRAAKGSHNQSGTNLENTDLDRGNGSTSSVRGSS